jgi:hypothetical protein
MKKTTPIRLAKFVIALAAFSIFNTQFSIAQYYDWGPSPLSVKWRTIKTPEVKLIFPDDFESRARRVKWYLDTVRTHINYGFSYGAMRTPVVIHTRNADPNGMVMWAPKRIELLAAPSATYSEPWLKQLAIHEYRHNVQYNNLRRGINRPLTWLLGEQIAFLGTVQFSIFILEGDATMAETEFSAFGRGLQPSWTMHYRAVGAVGSRDRSADYWFCGSFRNHVPSHYHLGYQMVRWGYDRLGDNVWNDVARYVGRNPQFITPMPLGLRHHYGLGMRDLFRRTFADLNAHWASLPKVEDSSERIATPENSYTTYGWPLWLDDGQTIVAFKSDLKSASRIVRVDAASGREKVVARTGTVSSRPALAGNVLWWTEFRRSLLWEEGTFSRLVSYDLDKRRMTTHRRDEQVFYPTPLPDGEMAWVAYDWSGRFSIVRGKRQFDLPSDVEVTGLAWDDATDGLYFIGVDDGGMFIGEVRDDLAATNNLRRLTPSRHITIADLRAGGGKLYFGSIASGRDEAHCLDLATGTEYRLSESTYGSFQPSVPDSGGRVPMTNYDRNGYHLALQNSGAATPQEQRNLPLDLVNPRWKRWDVPPMDSMVYTAAEAERSVAQNKTRRFSRMANIFQPHSWVPADFYPPGAIAEADLTMNLGATVMSQSLLSDAVTWLSYGWTRQGASLVEGGFSYNGLGPAIDVEFEWGGAPRTASTVIPEWVATKPGRHLAVATTLSLPMAVTSGRWYSTVTPAAEYYYTNGLIYQPQTLNSGYLTEGIERLTLSMRYSGQTRMALSEFQPRWGVTARVGRIFDPTGRNFRSLWSASAGVWLPGVVRPHGTRLRAAWQQSDNGNAPFIYLTKELVPRGALYNFTPQSWRSASVDYSLPVWYPEAGIPGILYFKRVRLNLFADYAQWRGFARRDTKAPIRHLNSWGTEITLDLNPLRLPATNNFSVTLTVAKPSDQPGPWLNLGMTVPL